MRNSSVLVLVLKGEQSHLGRLVSFSTHGMVENPLFLFHKLEEGNGKSNRGKVWQDGRPKCKGHFPSSSRMKKLPSSTIRIPKLRGISKDCLIDFSPI